MHTLNKRTARKTIIESRRQGKTDQEIYNELRQTSDSKEEIVMLITGIATDENFTKYKRHRYILVALLVLVAPVLVYFLYRQGQDEEAPPLVLIFSVLYLVSLPFSIYRLTKSTYRFNFLGALITPAFFSIVPLVVVGAMGWGDISLLFFLIVLTFVLAITSLEGYIQNRMLPASGKLKKDSDGEYILGHESFDKPVTRSF